MKRIRFAFYNLAPAGDPQRGPFFVARELNAIANNRPYRPWRRRPKVIAVSEAIGRRLPELKRYRLIRDTSTPGRANLALYVLRRLKVTDVEWVDHEREWPRVLHSGMHPARSTLVCRVEDWTVIVGHAPQAPTTAKRTANEGLTSARGEWVSIVARLLHRYDRVLLLTDPNGLGDDLMRAVPGMRTGGTAVEAAHVKGGALSWRTRAVVNGVRMLSDHKRCLLGRARKK